MEVFSSDQLLLDNLLDFFLDNKGVKFTGRDDDTIYFESIERDEMMFYIHFNNDFNQEMELNFKNEDMQFIKSFFGNKEVFMLDISYKDSDYLLELLTDFVRLTRTNFMDKIIPILFHDPFNGFVEM